MSTLAQNIDVLIADDVLSARSTSAGSVVFFKVKGFILITQHLLAVLSRFGLCMIPKAF